MYNGRARDELVVFVSQVLKWPSASLANLYKLLDSTDLDIAHPSIYTIFLALDVHDTGSTAVTQQDEDIVERGCLLELGHFFPGSDVMRPDQRVMEALHRFLKANYAVVRGQPSTHLYHDLLIPTTQT